MVCWIAVGIEDGLNVATVVELLVVVGVDADEALHALRGRDVPVRVQRAAFDRLAVPDHLDAAKPKSLVGPVLDVQFPVAEDGRERQPGEKSSVNSGSPVTGSMMTEVLVLSPQLRFVLNVHTNVPPFDIDIAGRIDGAGGSGNRLKRERR